MAVCIHDGCPTGWQVPGHPTLLVSCIVKEQMVFSLSVFYCNFSQHVAYFCSGYITVICDNQYLLGDIIHGTEDVIVPASREGLDKTPYLTEAVGPLPDSITISSTAFSTEISIKSRMITTSLLANVTGKNNCRNSITCLRIYGCIAW